MIFISQRKGKNLKKKRASLLSNPNCHGHLHLPYPAESSRGQTLSLSLSSLSFGKTKDPTRVQLGQGVEVGPNCSSSMNNNPPNPQPYLHHFSLTLFASVIHCTNLADLPFRYQLLLIKF